MAQHVFAGTSAPVSPPTKIGQHFIDTVGKVSYISVGTSSINDWVASTVPGGTLVSINPSTTETIDYILNDPSFYGKEWLIAIRDNVTKQTIIVTLVLVKIGTSSVDYTLSDINGNLSPLNWTIVASVSGPNINIDVTNNSGNLFIVEYKRK